MNLFIDKLENYINKYDNFILTTHESPDADGIGAEIGFKELLEKLNKKVLILNGDPTPDKYKFIDAKNDVNIISENVIPADVNNYALIVLDTNDFDNTGNTYKLLKDKVKNVFVIDHHECDYSCADHIIMPEASSASEIVSNMYFNYFNIMTFKTAQALYTGILFDTGSFRYPKTSPITFKTIAKLVEFGADPTYIYEKVYENNSFKNFILKNKVSSSLEVHFNNKLILQHLTPEMVKESKGNFSEGEFCINEPLKIAGVEASVLIKQDIEGPIKVSMRTKGDKDVAEIALMRNGGGHKNAAGYKSNLSWEETRIQVLDDMKKFFE